MGQRPMAFRRHKQSAGTACVRLQFTKPARLAMCERLDAVSIAVPLGDRPRYSLDEGRQIFCGLIRNAHITPATSSTTPAIVAGGGMRWFHVKA